jgi:hypothetical protein
MSRLYDETFISQLFTVLAVATPIAAVIGWAVHRRSSGGRRRRLWVGWAAFGLAGPLNYGLWPLYNSIEDHWGLDSVRALLMNFGIFIAVGLVIGLLLRFLLRPAEKEVGGRMREVGKEEGREEVGSRMREVGKQEP